MMRRNVLLATLTLSACTGTASDPKEDSGVPSEDSATSPTDAGTRSDATVAPQVDGGSSTIDAGPADDAAVSVDAGPPDTRPSSARHTAVPLGDGGAPNGYWEYLPPGYGDGTARPLLVFWHGVGENGNGSTDLDRVLANGPPRYIARDEWPNDRPFVVLSPQHSGSGCPTASEVRDFFDHALGRYAVDLSRVYLTGLSCGAIGSWNYLGQHVDASPVVAAVLIAGNGNGAWGAQACDLTRVAIWGFHGDADPRVPPDGTIVPMTHLIEDCPEPKEEQKLTVYPGVGHDSWARTYDGSAGHDVWSWLLSKRRAP